MKLTKQKLKQVIREELNEGFFDFFRKKEGAQSPLVVYTLVKEMRDLVLKFQNNEAAQSGHTSAKTNKRRTDKFLQDLEKFKTDVEECISKREGRGCRERALANFNHTVEKIRKYVNDFSVSGRAAQERAEAGAGEKKARRKEKALQRKEYEQAKKQERLGGESAEEYYWDLLQQWGGQNRDGLRLTRKQFASEWERDASSAMEDVYDAKSTYLAMRRLEESNSRTKTMRLTKQKLKQIIKEEFETVIQEARPGWKGT